MNAETYQLILDLINRTKKHLFVTGKAGTGKTTLLRKIKSNTYKKLAIAAPTGVAAINAGGVTIHSLLGLPIDMFVPGVVSKHESELKFTTSDSLKERLNLSQKKIKLIRELELLVIDEAGMLRADLLDCVDLALQIVKKNKESFGGLQLILIGDLFQLPPVIKDNEKELLKTYYNSIYFFDAKVFNTEKPVLLELNTVLRQGDQNFVNLLSRVRLNKQTPYDIKAINQCSITSERVANKGYTYLTTHNQKAIQINIDQLKKCDGVLFKYPAKIEGEFPEKLYPTDNVIELKQNAQIIFLRNDKSGRNRYYNGKMGCVSRLNKDEIWIKFDDSSEIQIQREFWENKNYILNGQQVEDETVGRFMQFPIKLAWAITIHKSQGLTLKRAVLDIKNCFTHGQFYVALSRLESMDGLRLTEPISNVTLEFDDELSSFQKNFLEIDSNNLLPLAQKEFLKDKLSEVFSLNNLISDLLDLAEKGGIEVSKIIHEHLEVIRLLEMVGLKFSQEIVKILKENSYLKILALRTNKAKEYFANELHELINSIGIKKSITGELESIYIKHLSNISKYKNLVYHLANGIPLQEMKLDRDQGAQVSDKAKDTRLISLNMLREGKTITEISEERNLFRGTVENHISHFIGLGELDVLDFISKSLLQRVTEVYDEECREIQLIKNKVGNDCTYGEINFAIAHIKHSEISSDVIHDNRDIR